MSAKTYAEKIKLMSYAVIVNGRSKRNYTFNELADLAEDIEIKPSTAYNLLREGTMVKRGIYSIRNLINKYVDSPCSIQKEQSSNLLRYGEKIPKISLTQDSYETELEDLKEIDQILMRHDNNVGN